MLKALSRFLARWASYFLSSIRAGNHAPAESASVSPSPALGSGPIVVTERISRFLLDADHIGGKDVTFRAFIPPNNGEWTQELSVSRTLGLSEPAVWAYGDEHVAIPSGRTIYGRADFGAGHVATVECSGFRLSIEPDEPPVRHARIVGWPAAIDRDNRKSLAIDLRAKCRPTRIVRPASVSG